MFSKLIRLSAVMATAVLASVSAAPVAEAASQQCASLGKGPLGFNASGIGIYSTNPPAVYVAIDDTTTNGDRLMASQKAKWEDQTMFEFFNCSYTPPPYFGKGSILTYQGYIKAPDGNCVSISALNTQGAYLSTVPCKFQDDSSMGGVDAVGMMCGCCLALTLTDGNCMYYTIRRNTFNSSSSPLIPFIPPSFSATLPAR